MIADLEQRLKALMIRAQAGDAAAWRELLSELGRRLSSYFARRMGSDHIAELEDLVQDTLIAIHTRRMTYDPGHPFTAWAFAIARHKLIDFWRRRRVRRHVPLDDVVESLWAPADTGAEVEVRADLDRALGTLPERQQRLVRDVRIEGLSLAEAGVRAGMTEGAAKVALHRAMKAMTLRMRAREDR